MSGEVIKRGKGWSTRKEERLAYYRDYHKRKYLENPAFYREQSKQKAQEIKREVLTYYGGGKLACNVCKEDRLPCLSIDHLAGGGRKHREGLKMKSSIQFYYWLRGQGYPEGYMTLCMNCQAMKRFLNSKYK